MSTPACSFDVARFGSLSFTLRHKSNTRAAFVIGYAKCKRRSVNDSKNKPVGRSDKTNGLMLTSARLKRVRR